MIKVKNTRAEKKSKKMTMRRVRSILMGKISMTQMIFKMIVTLKTTKRRERMRMKRTSINKITMTVIHPMTEKN